MDSILNKPEDNDESSGAGNPTLSNAIIIQGHHNTVQNVQQGNIQNVNPLQITADTERIREKLKDGYRSLKLPMVSWMSGGWANFLVGRHFIELQLNETIAAHTRKHEVIIPLTNIFDDVDGGNRPNRIFIESQPGFGKTTLTHKLINDWAEDEDYVRHFDLAILITLRSLKTKTTTRLVEDVLREKTKTATNDDCNQWKMINSDKTLLVLDGLDEVDDQCKENVLKILYDTFDYKMVIVTTGRTGLFKLDDKYKDVVHGGAQKCDKFWDKKISILGITERNRAKFLSTFIEGEDKRQHLFQIEHIINQFSGICDLDGEKESVKEDNSVEIGDAENELKWMDSSSLELFTNLFSSLRDLDYEKETFVDDLVDVAAASAKDLKRVLEQFANRPSGSRSSDLDVETQSVREDNSVQDGEMKKEFINQLTLHMIEQFKNLFRGNSDLDEERETDTEDNSIQDGETEKEYNQLISRVFEQFTNVFSGSSDLGNEKKTVTEGNSNEEYVSAKFVASKGTVEENHCRAEANGSDEIKNLRELADVTDITEERDNLNEMFKSPLLLILLAFIVERNCQVTIKTTTDLFKNLVDCLIRRSAAKNHKSLKQNFTIFVKQPNDSVSKEYLELYLKFGNMAIDRILNNDLHFECESDTDEIYELGLFIKHEQQEKYELLSHYEAFHLSILEFAAAFSIWRNFLKNGEELLVCDRDKINDVRRRKGVTSMVIPFLFGLMGRDGKKLLNQLSEYNLLYNTDGDLMKLVFTECDVEHTWNAVISNFVPRKIQFSRQSVFVNNPVLNKCLVILIIRSSELRFLNHAFNAKHLEVELDTWKTVNLNVLNGIKCEHLVLKFSMCLQNVGVTNLENLKKIVTISANSREVHLTSNTLTWQYINSKIFENVVIDVLYLSWDREFAPKVITSITEEALVVKLLLLQLLKDTDKEQLDSLSIISKSSNIDSLILLTHSSSKDRVNINLLTDNGRKKWKLLMVPTLFVEKSSHQTCYTAIDTFMITCGDSDVLEQAAPHRLGSTHELLHAVVGREYQWGGLESVVELMITFDPSFSKIPNLSYLRRFKRLKSVTLNFISVSTLLQTSLADLGRDLNDVGKVIIQIRIQMHPNLATIFDYIKDEIKNEQFNSRQRIVVIIEFLNHQTDCSTAESLKFIMATAPNLSFKFILWGSQSVNNFLDEIDVDYSVLSVAYKVCPLLKPWKHVAYFHRLITVECAASWKQMLQLETFQTIYHPFGPSSSKLPEFFSNVSQMANNKRRTSVNTAPAGWLRFLESGQEGAQMYSSGYHVHAVSVRNK